VFTGRLDPTFNNARGKADLRMQFSPNSGRCFVTLYLGTTEKKTAGQGFDFKRVLNSLGWISIDQLQDVYGPKKMNEISMDIHTRFYPNG
jgi:hypothetical protein